MAEDDTKQDGAGNARTPRSHRLPRESLADVRELVVALDALGGPSSRNLVFGNAKKAATGGAADQKWSAMGYYGLWTKAAGGKYELSARGAALIGDDPAAVLEAKQHAVMGTGFRRIVSRFSTRPVNATAIAGVLREDLSVPEAQAEKLAALLIEVATDAELIVGGAFNAAAIEGAAEAVPDPGRNGAPAAATRRAASTPARPKPAASVAPAGARGDTPPAVEKVEVAGEAGPLDVSVTITIDAHHHNPEEIGRIVSEVRKALTTEA